MSQNTKEVKDQNLGSKILSFLNSKTIGIVIGFFLIIVIILSLTSSSPDEQPSTYAAKKEEMRKEQVIPRKEPIVPKLERLPKLGKEKGEFKEYISGYKQKIYDSVVKNTMGSYDLPENLQKLLRAEIDTVIDNQLRRIYTSYSNYSLNIPATDSTKTAVFRKIK